MKLVIKTQVRENYGAHDWDGRGEAPQYWKNKGGATYIIDVNISEAKDRGTYSLISKCIEHFSEYYTEEICVEKLVDEIDFNISDWCDDWESPIYAKIIDQALDCMAQVKNFDGAVTATRYWHQDTNGELTNLIMKEYEEVA